MLKPSDELKGAFNVNESESLLHEIKDIDPKGNHGSDFLNMVGGAGVVYHNPMNYTLLGDDYSARIGQDTMQKRFQSQVRAFNTQIGGAVSSNGYVMIPLYIDNYVIDESRKRTPLSFLIPRVSNEGVTAEYNVIDTKGAAYVNSEDGVMLENDDVVERKSVAIKNLVSVGRVTGKAKQATPSYTLMGLDSGANTIGPFSDMEATNALRMQVLTKTRALMELRENLIVNGDASTNPLEYSGIVKLMGTTNTVDMSGNDLTDLNTINQSIVKAFDDGGIPTLGVCSSQAYVKLLGLLSEKIGFLSSSVTTSYGFTYTVYNTMTSSIPIFPSMFLSNSSNKKSFYFLDMSVVELRVLLDFTYEKLGKNNDSDKFFIKSYEALIIRNPAFCSSITNID